VPKAAVGPAPLARALRASSAPVSLMADIGPSHYQADAPPDNLGPIYSIAPGAIIQLGWALDAQHVTGVIEATLPAGVAVNGISTGSNWGFPDSPPTIGPITVPGDYRFDLYADDDNYGQVTASLTFELAGAPPSVLSVQAIDDSTGLGTAFNYPFPNQKRVDVTANPGDNMYVSWSTGNLQSGTVQVNETFSPDLGQSRISSPDEAGFQLVPLYPATDQIYTVSGIRNDTSLPDTVVLVIHVSGPTATLLSRFDATAGMGKVTLRYGLSNPAAFAGVNVYRQDQVTNTEQRLTPAPVATDGRPEYEWTDATALANMTYFYRLGLVDRAGQETRTAVITVHTMPLEFSVARPYPNPAASGTAFDLFMPQDGPLHIAVYDVSGRRVCTVFTGELSAGEHTIRWNGIGSSGRSLAGGVYEVVAEAFGKRVSNRLVLAR
jgi:hypothetical protein